MASERDEPRDAAGPSVRADARARHEPAHAVRDDVHGRDAGGAPDAVDRRREPPPAALDVAAEGGVAHAVEMDPAVAPEPAGEPEEIGGVLRVAVQEHDRATRLTGFEVAHALAAERERDAERHERRRRALERERAEPRERARGPGAHIVGVERTVGRVPAPMERRTRIRRRVEEHAAGERREHDERHEPSDRAHGGRTSPMAGRIKRQTCFSGGIA
jgi:hypothetical protein